MWTMPDLTSAGPPKPCSALCALQLLKQENRVPGHLRVSRVLWRVPLTKGTSLKLLEFMVGEGNANRSQDVLKAHFLWS